MNKKAKQPNQAATREEGGRSVSRDPAYMKDTSYCHTMETRDLGIRPTEQELKIIWQRSQYRQMMLEQQGQDKAASYNNMQLQQQQQQQQQQQKQINKKKTTAKSRMLKQESLPSGSSGSSRLTSGSNAQTIRQEETLQGEFDIISRRHVARFEQDSAFKKDRVETPETVAASRLGAKSRETYGL